MVERLAVLGAGMVGVCCALELQRRGFEVTLIDRREPGRETSYGNAGVLSRSSLLPFNEPSLWAKLPRLLGNRSASLRYDPLFLLRNLGWTLGFLARARQSAFEETATALDALIRLSTSEHQRLLQQAGATARVRTNGWLLLYRSAEAFQRAAFGREALRDFNVATEILGPAGLSDLEPHLRPIFEQALWIKDALSIDSPGKLVEDYARLFVSMGGRLQQREVRAFEEVPDGLLMTDATGERVRAERVVVALGPWSRDLLRSFGLRVPMAFERGYHMHYAAAGNAVLNRPVFDSSGGCVLSPMVGGIRLTTGIELTAQDAPASRAQLDLAERAARQAFPLDERQLREPWLGSRPTLPDSRPVIGRAPRSQNLWLAFGHQHIGFSTGPGTASLLGALMAGEAPPIDATPFRPERFLN